MASIIAYCGLNCAECPAYIATQSGDTIALEKLTAEWSTPGYPVTADDLLCDGCPSHSGRLFKFCRDCGIRECGVKKKVENCAACDEYPCGRLEKHFKMSPESKKRLDGMRHNPE